MAENPTDDGGPECGSSGAGKGLGGPLEHHRKEDLDMLMIEAATGGRNQLRYIAGADAKEIYETRMKVGDGDCAIAFRHSSRIRGRGYARDLTPFLAAQILAAGKTPFLHVKSENGAKMVYQEIGFRLLTAIYLTMISLH
jgi:FR47-like protein